MRLFKNLLMLLVLINFQSLAQITPNIGFEDGTFNHWECFTGSIDLTGNISVFPTTPISGRQTIVGKASANIVDMYGQFPVLCPNGSNYSVILGNSIAGKKADRVTYTFTAPASGPYSILFNYAVVLENPNHLAYQQPKFTAQVYDVTDDKYIECPSFDFVAGSALPGFKLSSVPGAKGASIYYKDWSTATIDLRGYHGKTIRLEFTTNDCTLGGHFGYAYLDVDDNSTSAPITGNAYCLGQNSVTLYGPVGFSDYYWYNADFTKEIGHGQSITLSPAPPNNTGYALKILPYPDLGCIDTLYTVINQINSGFKLNIPDTVRGCPGSGVDLTAAAVTAGSSPGMSLSYYTDSLASAYLYNPNAVYASGTYYIKGINAAGCMGVVPVHVALSLPVITIIEPKAVNFPTTVDLTKTVVHQTGMTYSYYSDVKATIPLENYAAVKYSGTYYIKAVNNIGCTSIAAVNITIHPPPLYTLTAPNTFTPNNDGINDHFSLVITGIVTFGNLKIFNRYGQLVFMGKSSGEYWDGNFNGKNLPAGTYYWVFEGRDDYYNLKITKASSITLLR
jgi:gliding motility-associated-like protein